MSKKIAQRKTSPMRDPPIDNRLNDHEPSRRRPCYQLIEREKQRDFRKSQLGILQDILFNQRNANKLAPKTRPTSAKNPTSSDWNRSKEEVGATERPRVSRSTRRDSQQQQPTRMARSQSRPTTSVTFMPDKSDIDPSPGQFKKLLVRLSSEMSNLESLTGFKSNKNDLSSYSSSTALATALVGLVGHVKQCASASKEINNLKNQLSIVISAQLDFQEKIENQISTLQTMMQTICQVVNHDMISNRRSYRGEGELGIPELHDNWLNNAQRPYLIEKDTSNAMEELLTFTRQMNNASPIDANRHSTYIKTLEASKKLTRPTSAVSTNENDLSKQHRNVDSTVRRASITSSIEMPLFESALPTSTNVRSASSTETVLEKILQERLRLVQQMNELNKQHEMTQEELAHLEAKTVQS